MYSVPFVATIFVASKHPPNRTLTSPYTIVSSASSSTVAVADIPTWVVPKPQTSSPSSRYRTVYRPLKLPHRQLLHPRPIRFLHIHRFRHRFVRQIRFRPSRVVNSRPLRGNPLLRSFAEQFIVFILLFLHLLPFLLAHAFWFYLPRDDVYPIIASSFSFSSSLLLTVLSTGPRRRSFHRILVATG